MDQTHRSAGELKALEPSHLGICVLGCISLAGGDASLRNPWSDREQNLIPPRIEQAEFLVCAGGVCIPTQGRLRVEQVDDTHYVLGHSTWEACRSRAHAEVRLAARIAEIDPHDLASEAISLDDLDNDASLWSSTH